MARKPAPPGKKWIWRPYITKNGRKIWAKTYGLRCFPILVDDNTD